MNWTKAANATGYIVIAVNTANVADVGATPVNGGDIETANISGLTVGATYDIYVVATAKGGFAFPDAAVPATAASASTPDVTPMPGPTLPLPTPTQTFPASAVGGDYDHDNDGLIEVRSLAQLNVIRLDLYGNSRVNNADIVGYLAAFPGALDDMGCPADGCRGYELAAHLDFDTNGNGRADAGDAHWNDGAGWEPISNGFHYSGSYRGYHGTFDGNGYVIANLHIDRPDPHFPVGLFGANQGTIRNVILHGVDVTGGGHVGGLVGVNSLFDFGSAISGSTVTGTVSGNDLVGGLVGSSGNNASISNNTASAAVSGNNHVGGLIGQNVGGGSAISGSTANGAVSGNDYVGGLIGQNVGGGSAISGSTANGAVSGNDYVGGLVGENHGNGNINGSKALGDVTGRVYVGGLVGLNNRGVIADSTASGNVAGVRYLGALVGLNDGGTITNSTGTGTVTARQ